MNLCFITAQIVSQPKIIRLKANTIIIILVSIPNNKKNISFCTIKLCFTRFLSNQILFLYKKNDFLVIEGSIQIKAKYLSKEENFQFENKKMKKYIAVKLRRIHPYQVD